MEHPIDVSCMFPDKLSDAWVFLNDFIAIFCLIPSSRPFDQDVIDKQDGDMWYLILEQEGNVTVGKVAVQDCGLSE